MFKRKEKYGKKVVLPSMLGTFVVFIVHTFLYSLFFEKGINNIIYYLFLLYFLLFFP